MAGKVYIVGAGPGDTGLVTVKGLNCIRNADVIVYDNLVNPDFLSYAKESTEKIYVGKYSGNHSLPQDEINELLVKKAQTSEIVVRLKGGDPFIFGRGGEEALFLKENNIKFEIVPGISSCAAVPAYAGIPVTHRGLSSSFHVITGHETPDKDQNQVDYGIISKLTGTLVFLMGFNNLQHICNELLRHGKTKDTPAAVIFNGTCPDQITIIGTLENIAEETAKVSICNAPAIIVIGETVNLRENLQWLEKKPLWGRKIIITRAKNQNREFAEKIESLGGMPIEFSAIEIKPSRNEKLLKKMYKNLAEYDWIIFTSVNGVEIFFENILKYGIDIRQLHWSKICAIGEITAVALEKHCIKPDLVPDEYVAESLILKLKSKIKKGDTILISGSEDSRGILPEELVKMRADVDVIPLYKTVLPDYNRESLDEALKVADSVCFTSSSTVTNFLKILEKESLKFPEDLKVYCIGPITADTAKENRLNVHKIAAEYTVSGLLNALTEN